jgi:hypothetical protein
MAVRRWIPVLVLMMIPAACGDDAGTVSEDTSGDLLGLTVELAEPSAASDEGSIWPVAFGGSRSFTSDANATHTLRLDGRYSALPGCMLTKLSYATSNIGTDEDMGFTCGETGGGRYSIRVFDVGQRRTTSGEGSVAFEFVALNSSLFQVEKLPGIIARGGGDLQVASFRLPASGLVLPYVTEYSPNGDDDFGYDLSWQFRGDVVDFTLRTYDGNDGSRVVFGFARITSNGGTFATAADTFSGGSVSRSTSRLAVAGTNAYSFATVTSYYPDTQDEYGFNLGFTNLGKGNASCDDSRCTASFSVHTQDGRSGSYVRVVSVLVGG